MILKHKKVYQERRHTACSQGPVQAYRFKGHLDYILDDIWVFGQERKEVPY
jgi:hypothetical protein